MEEQLLGPVRFLPGENRGRYPYCNSLYVEMAGILIDPSSNRKRLIRLRNEADVKMVWLSHWHEDHFMHLDLFDDLPLWVSPLDAPPLADLSTFLTWYGFSDEEKLFWRSILQDQFHFRPRRPARHLIGGETITLGPLSIDVIATPGHTPGHLAFFFREASLLFTGDYDLTRFGPWYGDLYSSIAQTRASIDLLRNIPAKSVITGHETGLFSQPLNGLWESYGGIIPERETRLLNVLDKPKALEAIVEARIIYGKPREPKEFFDFGERVHMKKHLDDLQARGIVIEENGLYRRTSSLT
ncbi:MAG TPA: MBL fold metallo-hydrolase [Syntrophus sp. (in: bacteria)]|nr:MBL fold metallo-hydrolase [Syntrophus sp. (in: bacteria)]